MQQATPTGTVQPQLPQQQQQPQFRYQQEIAQMMYTFGEVRHPIPETTQLLEAIVRQQMIELLIQAAHLCRRRGSRYLSHEDLLFLIRRDRLKVARLTAYLSWRKVRKVANRAGGGATGGASGASAGGSGTDLLMDDDPLLLMEDATAAPLNTGTIGGSGLQSAVAGQAKQPPSAVVKRLKIRLPWNPLDHFEHLFNNDYDDEEDEEEAEDNGDNAKNHGCKKGPLYDDDEQLYNAEARQRLLYADLLTQKMSHEEYLDYAECRQASFTYKKPTRFREWLSIEQHTGMRPSNDLLDVLGFLCYEMVRTLTEQCLAVKREMEMNRKVSELNNVGDLTLGGLLGIGGVGGSPLAPVGIVGSVGGVPNPTELSTGTDFTNAIGVNARHNPLLALIRKEFRKEYGKYDMFASPDERTAIEPVHVHEAYRRLQQNDPTILSEFTPKGTAGESVRNDGRCALRTFSGGRPRVKMSLI